MEIEGEKILKRIKKVPLWTWIGYVICVIVIGVAISSIDSKERTQKPEPIDLTTNGGIGIEENKYAYQMKLQYMEIKTKKTIQQMIDIM